MLKPPINDLVCKITEELGPDLGPELGNRYSLVLAIAKRARVIALNEDNEKEKEAVTFESRISDRFKTKEIIKPIHKAIDEFHDEKIEVYHRTPEDIKAEEKALMEQREAELKAAELLAKTSITFLDDDEETEE